MPEQLLQTTPPTDRQSRWLRVREIFESVFELPMELRDRRIDELCAQDLALAAEVRDLLACHLELDEAAEGGPLDRPIFELLPGEPGSVAGRRLGPYVLEDVLGHGGMGTVWRARRADGEMQRQVAIKVLRADVASSRLAERLRRERQILAELRHPSIARLYDGGTTDDGRPYLVMELIEGRPLDLAVDRSWSLRSRLELLISICHAVDHAHQRGVIHRDLKPANILVDDQGQPFVVDFGIAALAQPIADLQTLTETGKSPMTLRYASPEQLRSAATGPSSDVFALGVLLFELLTDRSPWDETTPLELARAVAEAPTPRPSKIDAPFTSKQLRGDLDAITACALAKNPAARYANAGELAQDLRRHLHGQPLTARPGSWATTYAWARWHRKPLLMGATALAMVTTFSWQQHRVVLEHRAANAATTVAMGSLGSWSADGSWPTDGSWQPRIADWRRGFAGRPDLLADLLAGTGSRLSDAGYGQEALPMIQEAIELRRRQDDDEALAVDLGRLGDLQLEHGAFPAAAANHQRSLQLLDNLGHTGHPQRARSLTGLGLALSRNGDTLAGERRLRQGLNLSRAFVGTAGLGQVHLQDSAMGLHRYGRALIERSAFHQAAAVLGQGIEMARRAFGEQSPRLAMMRFDAATAANGRSQFDEAQRLLQPARQTTQTLPPRHPARWLDLKHQAYHAMLSTEFDAAETLAREFESGARQSFGESHPFVHDSHGLLCQVLRGAGRQAEAREACEQAVQSARELYGAAHPRVADALIMWAEAIEPLDRPRAMAVLRQARQIYRDSVGEDHPMVALIHHYLSLAHFLSGDFQLAETLHTRAIDGYLATLGDGHPSLAYSRMQYGGLLANHGRIEEGLNEQREAIATLERGLGPEHPRAAWLWARLAIQLTHLGQREEAASSAQRAFEIAGGVRGARGGPQAAALLLYLGQGGPSLQRQLNEARPHLSAATRRQLSRLYERLGEPLHAEAWRPIEEHQEEHQAAEA